jgi:hypothetical protein
MKQKYAMMVATTNPALRRIVGMVLKGISLNSSAVSYKEYIDCGGWTVQA